MTTISDTDLIIWCIIGTVGFIVLILGGAMIMHGCDDKCRAEIAAEQARPTNTTYECCNVTPCVELPNGMLCDTCNATSACPVITPGG